MVRGTALVTLVREGRGEVGRGGGRHWLPWCERSVAPVAGLPRTRSGADGDGAGAADPGVMTTGTSVSVW